MDAQLTPILAGTARSFACVSAARSPQAAFLHTITASRSTLTRSMKTYRLPRLHLSDDATYDGDPVHTEKIRCVNAPYWPIRKMAVTGENLVILAYNGDIYIVNFSGDVIRTIGSVSYVWLCVDWRGRIWASKNMIPGDLVPKQVLCYTEDGQLVDVVHIKTTNPTIIACAGNDLVVVENYNTMVSVYTPGCDKPKCFWKEQVIRDMKVCEKTQRIYLISCGFEVHAYSMKGERLENIKFGYDGFSPSYIVISGGRILISECRSVSVWTNDGKFVRTHRMDSFFQPAFCLLPGKMLLFHNYEFFIHTF